MPDQGAHILVVDDEPHARRISVRLLQQAGYTVSEAATGEEGLRQARALRPDLILLDVVLPDLDGLEVCRRVKAAPDLAYTPVLLLSGKRVDSHSLAEGLEGGANGYILRGTPTREFLARVAAWLRIQQVEEALRQERDLVARIMETSPVGIVVLDREGHITFVNAQVEQVTGLTREQIVQLDYNDPTWQMVDQTGRQLDDALLPFPRLMQTKESIYDLQQTVELPSAGDGPRRLRLSMNAAPLFDASDETDGVIITFQDVTERVHLQELVEKNAAELEQRVAERTAELEASQAALLHAERLAIAGKLAASLTHEISNPLQSVIGCLGLAEETLDEGGDVHEYLDVALSELRRVARIVARLRNLGRPPSPLSSREPTDVGELLEQVRSLMRKPCQDRGIALDWQVPSNLPQVHVVPDQLQQVFLNLALNAIEAMPVEARAHIDVRAGRKEGAVYILFKDSGVGISCEALPHIFDPFYSTKPEGLGLGLSISQEIVQQHGGRIEAQSELGHGATFTVWLPAAPGALHADDLGSGCDAR